MFRKGDLVKRIHSGFNYIGPKSKIFRIESVDDYHIELEGVSRPWSIDGTPHFDKIFKKVNFNQYIKQLN